MKSIELDEHADQNVLLSLCQASSPDASRTNKSAWLICVVLAIAIFFAIAFGGGRRADRIIKQYGNGKSTPASAHESAQPIP